MHMDNYVFLNKPMLEKPKEEEFFVQIYKKGNRLCDRCSFFSNRKNKFLCISEISSTFDVSN